MAKRNLTTDGQPFTRFTGKKPGFYRGSMPPGAPPFGAYSLAYAEAARILVKGVREQHTTLDIMGVPVVQLYRHAIETALKGIFERLTALEVTNGAVTARSFVHDLEKLLGAVEAAVENHVRNWRGDPRLRLNVANPFSVDAATRSTLAELNDRNYPERYPAAKWSTEYDLDRFEEECDSTLIDLDLTLMLIEEVAALKGGYHESQVPPEHDEPLHEADDD